MKQKNNPSFLIIFLALCWVGILNAQNSKTPMMGWSSWNTFRININEDLIKQTADAMIEKGLKDAGYTFINVDDGFFAGRSPEGNLNNNDEKFPNGMKSVADYIHSKGLKAGIYSEAGKNTCAYKWDNDKKNGLNVGFYGHEEEDCDLYFSQWGYDFIKVDYCGAEDQGLDEETQYTKIWNAMQKTGRDDIRWNVCRWMFPGTWVTKIAGSWRISHDIRNNFDDALGVRDILEHNLYMSAYASPGHFNDMDMMQIGRGNFSEDEEKGHFGLWCIMNSPLMIGCDLRTIPQRTLDVITNKEVIAINQDILGIQAQVVKRDGKRFVLAKQIEVANGKIRAVALFNGSNNPSTMSINFNDIQLSGKVKVRDLWAKADIGEFIENYTTTIPAHGIAMLRLEGESSFDKTIFEGEDAFMNAYNAVKMDNNARFEKAFGASGDYKMSKLGNSPDNWAEFRNIYSSTGGTYKLKVFYYSDSNRELSVFVNNTEYQLTGLNSGNMYSRGRKSVEIKLNQGNNVIRLANNTDWAPDIDKIELRNPDEPNDDHIIDIVEPDYEIINNPKFPTLSSEDDSNETWYYIQFCNGAAVIEDMGDGQNILTKQKIKGLDSQLWKVVETGIKGEYHIINKSGRKISFNSSRYLTSSSYSQALKILSTTNNAYAPAWEIQRKGESNCMNQFGGAGVDMELGEWTQGDKNNPLQFIAADKYLNYMPEISSDEKDVWYYVQFNSGGGFLEDMGTNEYLTIQLPKENAETQLWKITGTKEQYTLTNKAGRTITFDNEFYKASDSESTLFKLLYTENEDYAPGWELQRTDITDKCMNQYGGSSIGNKIGEWYIKDDNNVLSFLLPSEIRFNFPIISKDNEEKWYYIQFKNGNGTLQDMGEDGNLLTKKIDKEIESQHWKVIETDNSKSEFKYRIVNKSGRSISHVSSPETSDGIYQASNNPEVIANFNIVATTNTTYAPAWELHRQGSDKHMNQYKGAGIDRNISEWNKGDNGNPLVFIDIDSVKVVEAIMPEISSEDNSNEIWYYINFIDSKEGTKAMMEDLGNGISVMTKDWNEDKDEQLWKIILSDASNGDYKYQFVSATGRKIAWNESRYISSSSSFVNLRLNELAPYWGIEREGAANGLGMTQTGLGPEQEIKEDYYSAIGNGKLIFEKASRQPTSITRPDKKTNLQINENVLFVEGEDIMEIRIYAVSGQILFTKTSSFIFSFSNPGIYFAKITFNDLTSKTKKVYIK